MNLSTFSITARCERTGMFGVAVSTKRPAVGARCPFAKAGVGAISSQAWANPYIGIYGLKLLELGWNAELVRDSLIAWDPDIERRQFTVVDREGRAAAFTGEHTVPWQGHRTGPNYAAAGNMLVGSDTVEMMAIRFEQSADKDLPERLLLALEAGQAAGGDKRGKQSAALYVVHEEDYPFADLRVDDHQDPVGELRRIFEVCENEYFPFIKTFPTRANPKGDYEAYLRLQKESPEPPKR